MSNDQPQLEPTEEEPRSPERPQRSFSGTYATLVRNGIVAALVLEIIFFAVFTERFLTVSNFRLVLLQTSGPSQNWPDRKRVG